MPRVRMLFLAMRGTRIMMFLGQMKDIKAKACIALLFRWGARSSERRKPCLLCICYIYRVPQL
jgi:hypothetical protein